MSQEAPAPSETLAHFRLIEKIGEGGMGVVHKAWDTRLERVVALKVISRELLRHDQSRTRLLREARIASSLNHPNIATIHGLEEADGKDIIVMEYVQGPTLRDRLGTGPIEVRDVMDLAVAVADALGEAHAQNVVHRDIKPENIILTPRGHPKIMDFGLAKLLRPRTAHDATTGVGQVSTRITSEGAALGTVAYMSPEQAVGKDVDVRTDVFSFGVVLYEMLTQAAPFLGDSDVDILYEILHHEPRPIAELNPDVPSDLQTIVSRCTAKEPSARYSSAIRIRDDLKRARISLDVQRARTLHTLFSISKEMTAILSLEPLLERIADLVKSLIEYDMLGIFRADMKTGRLYWLGGSGYDPERAKARDYRVDEGICGRAIRTREAVRVGDVRKDPDYYPPNGQQFQSNLVVPLIHGDNVVGVLNMESRQASYFTNEHATIMATLAGPIAVAMENARLFEKQNRHAQALERLHDIGREVASILDLDQLLERVGELTRRMIDHELFTVFLLDEETGEFTWRTAQGYDPEFVREHTYRLGEGVISRAARQREALIVNDTAKDPDYISPRSVDGRPSSIALRPSGERTVVPARAVAVMLATRKTDVARRKNAICMPTSTGRGYLQARAQGVASGTLGHDAPLQQEFYDSLDAGGYVVIVGGEFQRRIRGRFKGRADTGEISDLTFVGRAIHALMISLATDFHRCRQMHDQKAVTPDNVGRPLADFFAGGQKRGDADQPGVVHEPGDFRAAAEVLTPVVGTEAQVTADAAAHVLPIQYADRAPHFKQPALQGIGERRLARSRQAGQENRGRLLAESGRPLLARHAAPLIVQCLTGAIVPMVAAVGRRRAVEDHARADRHVGNAIDDDERAGSLVAAIGVVRDRLIELDLASADLVEPQCGGVLTMERVDVDLVAERRHLARRGSGCLLEQVLFARQHRLIVHPDHHGIERVLQVRHVVRPDEHVAPADVDFILKRDRDRLRGKGFLLLSFVRDDRFHAASLS